MARLCIPGVPFVKGRATHRFKTPPTLRYFHRSVTKRVNPAASYPSFLPVFLPRAGVPSFAEMRKGSRLPVRSVSPPWGRSLNVPPLSFPRNNGSFSRLEQRKTARQTRSRPWARPKSTGVDRSRERKLSSVAPCSKPPKPKISAIHTARARRATARTENVPVKPMASVKRHKDKSVRKCVRFGDVTVLPVSRWIARQDDVFSAPPAAMGYLQGWTEIPLKDPDEDGEDSKYITYWGSDSYVMLESNHASGPCGRVDCAWNSLARIQAERPAWTPPMVFKAWLMKRAMVRRRGGFAL